MGGYALHYTLTTHPLDTLGEAVQTLAAEERQPAFQRMRTPDHYSFSQMVMTLGNSDLLIHYPNDIEKAEVFTDAADSLQDAAELTKLPLLRNDFVDDLPDGAALYCPADPNDYHNPVKRKVLLYGTCADGEPFGLNVLDGGLLEKEVSGESYDMYISFNAHAAVTPSGSRTATVEQVLTDGIYDLKDGWTCEEYTLPTGDIAVIIDVDLQDPPEVIPQMIDTYLKEGSNVVYAVRNKREGETFMKKFTAKIYYRMLNSLSDYTFPVDTGDFRLIDRKVLDAFKQFPEKHKYLRGLFSWMGFKQTPFYYTRNERAAGRTKYSIRKMFSLASAGIFGFSKKPLKLAISLGTLSIFIALAFAIWVFIMYLSGKESIVPGWSSTIITIVFLGGVQLFTIGILGEYIGNIFDETKNRPEYIIDKKINFDPHNNQTI